MTCNAVILLDDLLQCGHSRLQTMRQQMKRRLLTVRRSLNISLMNLSRYKARARGWHTDGFSDMARACAAGL
jgi:hypothetical protein